MSIIDAIKRRISGTGAGTQPVSTGYQLVAPEAQHRVSSELRDSWRDRTIPAKQRALVDEQLVDYRRGEPVVVFDALVDILRNGVEDLAGAKLLEIGCSSGYYSEAFEIKGLRVRYEGCDYSPAFIELARQRYPGLAFDVQDATQLRYGDAAFDVVVSGGCILHIPEYERAIAETARVSRRWVVFHRTPVLHMHGPIIYTKKAYGVDTIEIHFNEQALLRLFSSYGLRVVDINTHSIGWEQASADALAMKTYLCERLSAP